MENGTAYTLGQYNQVLIVIASALPKALEGLDPKQVIKSLQNRGEEISRLLRKDLDVLMAAPVFSRDMRKEGWELVEDVSGPDAAKIIIADLETVSFLLKGDETSVSGEIMRQRAIALGANLGQRHAEFLLEHQEEIPVEFRKFYLVFPGTIWRGSGGCLDVPCLRWFGKQWRLIFSWLGYDWGFHDRLVRPRK